jgi:calcineurin-like phosphoesterase family protein
MTANYRGFADDVQEHDDAVIDSFSGVTKRDKIFVLGDISMTKMGLLRIRGLPTQNLALLMGNHDVHGSDNYLHVFSNIIGPIQYRGFWLSHIPIHPQEMFRCAGNIHGHLHKGGATPPLPCPPYFNVCWDFHRGPVLFETIRDALITPQAEGGAM